VYCSGVCSFTCLRSCLNLPTTSTRSHMTRGGILKIWRNRPFRAPSLPLTPIVAQGTRLTTFASPTLFPVLTSHTIPSGALAIVKSAQVPASHSHTLSRSTVSRTDRSLLLSSPAHQPSETQLTQVSCTLASIAKPIRNRTDKPSVTLCKKRMVLIFSCVMSTPREVE